MKLKSGKVNIIIFASICCLFMGCTVKNNDKEENKEKSQRIEEVMPENGNSGMETDYGEIIIKDKYVELEYLYDPFPKGEETVVMAFQNGIPVPFAFQPDGEYKTVQRKTFEERTESSIYIKAESFKKGDRVSFGMGYVMEPDYMPKIQEYTSYIPHQFTATTSKEYTMKQDFVGETKKNVLKDVQWETYETDTSIGISSYVTENDDMEVLKEIMSGKPTNDVKVIQAKGKESIRIYYMIKASLEEGFQGRVTFFLDHQPLKINGEYDAFIISPPASGYMVAAFDVALPEGLEPGAHTFYSWAIGEESRAEYTTKRVLMY